jgi:hypothetical protein
MRAELRQQQAMINNQQNKIEKLNTENELFKKLYKINKDGSPIDYSTEENVKVHDSVTKIYKNKDI